MHRGHMVTATLAALRSTVASARRDIGDHGRRLLAGRLLGPCRTLFVAVRGAGAMQHGAARPYRSRRRPRRSGRPRGQHENPRRTLYPALCRCGACIFRHDRFACAPRRGRNCIRHSRPHCAVPCTKCIAVALYCVSRSDTPARLRPLSLDPESALRRRSDHAGYLVMGWRHWRGEKQPDMPMGIAYSYRSRSSAGSARRTALDRPIFCRSCRPSSSFW